MRLRAIDPSLNAYLDWVLEIKGLGRHRFLRSLLALGRKMTPELFIKSIERAAKYRIEDIHTIERIAILHLQEGSDTLPVAQVDEQFTRREAYLEGALTDLDTARVALAGFLEDHMQDHCRVQAAYCILKTLDQADDQARAAWHVLREARPLVAGNRDKPPLKAA